MIGRGNWNPYYLERMTREELLKQLNKISSRVALLEENPVPHDTLVELVNDVIADGVDLSGYYGKTEIDDKLSSIYTKSQVDALISGIASGVTYTKSEIDMMLQNINSQLFNFYNKMAIDLKFANYYTKAEIDAMGTGGNVDLSNYYTKAEVDALIAGGADLSDYYNKAEVDAIVGMKQQEVITRLNAANTVIHGLRFTSEENLAPKTTIYYPTGQATGSDYQTAYDAAITSIDGLGTDNADGPFFLPIYEFDPGHIDLNAFPWHYVRFALNPAFNLFNPDTGVMRDPNFKMIIRSKRGPHDGDDPGDYYYQTVHDAEEFINGQILVWFGDETEFRGLQVGLLFSYDDGGIVFPSGGVDLNSYIAYGKSIKDKTILGLWFDDEAGRVQKEEGV